MVEANRRAWLNGGVISNYTYEATQQLQTTQCADSVITPFYRFSGLAILFQIADANAGVTVRVKIACPANVPESEAFIAQLVPNIRYLIGDVCGTSCTGAASGIASVVRTVWCDWGGVSRWCLEIRHFDKVLNNSQVSS